MAPVFGDGAGREGSALFAYLNTNKHSVEVDVTSAAGALRLHELVGTADAVIDDSAVSWADRHPSVVFCSITPFGQGAAAEFENAKSINVFHASGWGYHTPSHADPARPPLQGWRRRCASRHRCSAVCILVPASSSTFRRRPC
jgi:crotonobetainyl-CoA:carnitine CoA-transferase CaiB-like acyl-CoA transferase